jgi:hypothetical protein
MVVNRRMQMSDSLTVKQAIDIGMSIRGADDGNLIVGSFAADIAGESYPLSKNMAEIIFRDFTDEQLGRKFVAWADERP